MTMFQNLGRVMTSPTDTLKIECGGSGESEPPTPVPDAPVTADGDHPMH
jgi:hypothetical protein